MRIYAIAAVSVSGVIEYDLHAAMYEENSMISYKVLNPQHEPPSMGRVAIQFFVMDNCSIHYVDEILELPIELTFSYLKWHKNMK